MEGANGAGRPLAQRLLEDGEQVVDVPAKLAARVRLFDTGHNRKTDALDAHSIAIVAVRTEGLRVLKVDGELQALRMLTDRREALTRRRVQTVNRLQALLAELLPGQAKKDISPLQAKAMLASVRPRDVAGRTCRRLAAEELAELIAVEAKMKKATAELKVMVLARRSRLMDLRGVGPVVAARVLADVGDVARFADRNRFASWNGTAPLDASSGEQNRHRLSRAGNRRMNHMIHIAAVTQLRHDDEGRTYYRRKRGEGKKPMEAMRCLKRRTTMAAEPINDPDTPADPRAADRQRRILLHAALLAVNAGYFVFPVRPGGKEPALDKDWEGQATRDRVVVRRWWRRTPHNVGIAAGPSGVVVVDLDDGHGATAPEPFAGARHGLEVLTRLAARAGAEVPTDTFTVLTPSGGSTCTSAPRPRSSCATPRACWAGGSTPAPAGATWSAPARSARRAATGSPGPGRCGSFRAGCGRR